MQERPQSRDRAQERLSVADKMYTATQVCIQLTKALAANTSCAIDCILLRYPSEVNTKSSS